MAQGQPLSAAHELNDTALRVLMIDDDPADAYLVRARLLDGIKQARVADELEFTNAETLSEGLEIATTATFDVILLDLGLPDGQGIENVERVLARVAGVPTIVLTGLVDEKVAIEALRIGAQDYVVKADLGGRTLVRAVAYALERHRLVQAIERARREDNDAKDRLLSHISHELRTPLTAVMSFASIMQERIAGPLTSEQEEYLGIIRRNAEQLKHVITSLMDVTRADAGKLQCDLRISDPGSIARDAADAFRRPAANAGIGLTTTVTPGVGPIVADSDKLAKVLSNLVANAIESTPEGGSIEVGVAPDPDRGERLRFSVRDTGCGIPEGEVETVFERMHQVGEPRDVRRNGLGLGLHICQEIVRLHGGEIGVESAPGTGSTFWFSVPLHSLSAFVQRVIVANDRVQPGLCVVTAKVRPETAVARAKGPGTAVNEVAGLARKCLIAIHDVVLPIGSGSDGANAVYILARTDEAGGGAVVDRLRGELADHPRLLRNGFEVDVSLDYLEFGEPPSAIDQGVLEMTGLVNACITGNVEQGLG